MPYFQVIKLITILDQIRSSDASSIRGDLLAGLTVAIMVIPQGMAYAMLAGLPPVYGLYAALVPVMIYPLFGTSRQLSVGPVALVSIIVLEGLSALAAPGSPEFIQLALLTSLIAGLIQVILSLARMGFLVNFLSEPVISGFTAAAALIIGVSQLQHLFGVQVERSNSLVGMVGNLASEIGGFNIYTFIVGIVGIAIIMGLKRVRRALPGGLIAVIISALAVTAFGLEDNGVAVVGEVRRGLPPFEWIPLDINTILRVLPLAGIICIISFIESLAIAKRISARHQNYPIDANQELFALGIAKVIGSFFGAYPNTGSFTRSAINDEAGASTGLSSIFAGVIIILTLIFLTPLFYFLPKAVLASIVVVAVVGLIDIREIRYIYKVDRRDFYVLMTTLVLTLILGVQIGVFAGVALSALMILYKTSRPHYAILGRLEGTDTFRNIKRYPDARIGDDYLILRYDVDIYFGNAEHFYDTVMKEAHNHKHCKYLILNMAAIGTIDSTGLHKMKLLIDALASENITLLLAGTRGNVRDSFATSGIHEKIGAKNTYLTILDAIEGRHSTDHDLSNRYASQSNVGR